MKEADIVSAIEAHRMIAEGALPIDTRLPDVFGAGHIPGAANYPLADLMTADCRNLGPVTVYCQNGAQVRQHADLLNGVFGAEHFFALAYGFEEWLAAGLPVAFLNVI